MTLTKKDKEEIVEIIKTVLKKPEELHWESTKATPTWQPEATLNLEYDGGTKVAMNPYWEIDENVGIKTEFTWREVQEINKKLPEGWRVATRHDFAMILEEIGRNEKDNFDGTLADKTGWSGGFWSSTSYGSAGAWGMGVGSSRALVSLGYKTGSYGVVCIGS